MRQFMFESIGVIRTPYTSLENMPIQPAGAKDVEGLIELNHIYADGLDDVDGFSRVILLYAFHQSQGWRLKTTPFLDNVPRGLFATRAPKRPYSLGLSIVRVTSRDANTLNILDVDMLDGTPLLDIKPYIPALDAHADGRIGWMEGRAHNAITIRSDNRFTEEAKS